MLTNSVKLRQYRIPRKDSEPLVETVAPSLISAKRIREPGGLQELTMQLMLIWHFGCKANSPAGHRWLSYLMDAGSLSWSGMNLLLVPSGYLLGGILPKAHNSPNYFMAFYTYTFFRIIPIYTDVIGASPISAAPHSFDGVTP
jgi:peptidoglycan/LPS O-acetylase OafA/YrhL